MVQYDVPRAAEPQSREFQNMVHGSKKHSFLVYLAKGTVPEVITV